MIEWSIRRMENLDKAAFPGVGKYDIPAINPVFLKEPIQMIGFNFAKSYKHRKNTGVHFFVKDYMFTRIWDSPDAYVPMLSQFKFVCTPDFSMYIDYPLALQINSHYRKHWLGAYWQSKGMTVVPTICWSDERSFDWCFDGEPWHSTVAVSSVGTQADDETKRLFALGFAEMLRRLRPATILFHGRIPEGIQEMVDDDKSRIKVIKVLAFQSRLHKMEGRDS